MTTSTMDKDLEKSSDEPILGKSIPADDNSAKRGLRKVARKILVLSVVLASIGALHCCCCSKKEYEIQSLLVESTESTAISSSVIGLIPPIPPIHPHHSGFIEYSSHMKPDESVDYRREITAPCNYGMLLFNVGPAKEELPYTYDVYQDAYLFSNNENLCILYPTYKGYQVADFPFWEPEDPRTITVKPLGSHQLHRISSRIVKPSSKSTKKINPNRAGDYIIIGKHNFYTVHFFQQLKATVQQWADADNKVGDEGFGDLENFLVLQA